MENPFAKLVSEGGDHGITDDLERQLREAKEKLGEEDDDDEREKLEREIEDIERTISEISQ